MKNIFDPNSVIPDKEENDIQIEKISIHTKILNIFLTYLLFQSVIYFNIFKVETILEYIDITFYRGIDFLFLSIILIVILSITVFSGVFNKKIFLLFSIGIVFLVFVLGVMSSGLEMSILYAILFTTLIPLSVLFAVLFAINFLVKYVQNNFNKNIILNSILVIVIIISIGLSYVNNNDVMIYDKIMSSRVWEMDSIDEIDESLNNCERIFSNTKQKECVRYIELRTDFI